MKPCKPNSPPCKECPYRTDSAPGWLGGNTVEQYSNPIVYDIETPCHKTMEDGVTARYCAGLAMVRVNSCKRSRFSSVIALSEANVKDSPHREKCFKFKMEFESHHE